MKLALLFLAAAGAAYAHVISMSTGFATVDGRRVEYILRMPAYEMAHIQGAKGVEQAIFDHIRFQSGFETARRVDQECHNDPATGNFVCAANYEFAEPVERLGVDCSFYEITVPNHIHMLHAERAVAGGERKIDQAILDSSFPSATMAFRPPTAVEIAMLQSGAGAVRVFTNWAQLLLLVALAIASRSRRELLYVGAAFLAGECLGAIGIVRSSWQPQPRFAEAAAALALAYLALEILVFPQSKGRWLLALVFGAFEGMYFSLFVDESGYRAGYVLSGAAVAGAVVLAAAALLGYGLMKSPAAARYRVLLTRVAAGLLMIVGAVWFGIRLRG